MKKHQALCASIKDSFWTPIQSMVIDKVLPYQADILEDKVPTAEKSGAINNFRIAAGEIEGEFYGMVFQDSDLAKWIEAAAYALGVRRDEALEKKADEIISLIGRAQQPDGYLNTYFILKEPERKWQNLMECHELYCSGHMIEAAVAYYNTTGKDSLLNTMRRNADLICSRFGEGEGKVRGIPGHQEIELALYRLYQVTGEKKYLETAQYFLNERGKEPNYFAEEESKRDWHHWGRGPHKEYAQNHAPVREQSEAVGHSVRAVYMYTAMAAIAAETGEEALLTACRTLWDNIVNKRMYITGGVGSTHHGEAFTVDYDLPNDTIYAETCASIAMVFFARKMLDIEPMGEYADIMEKQLYNGVLSGMNLEGTHFFYVNPLEVVPGVSGKVPGLRHALPKRPQWYGCACCPPNVSRLLTSLGYYSWGENEKGIYNHLYMGGSIDLQIAGGVRVDCESNYPWGGDISYKVQPKANDAEFSFAIRIPKWCLDNENGWSLTINGETEHVVVMHGYAYIMRKWQAGDEVRLTLTMKPRRMYANTKVRADAGCAAIMYGPLVYCFEECDNGADLSALRLQHSSEITAEKSGLFGGSIVLKTQGIRVESCGELYSEAPPKRRPVPLQAVPYYAWGNRETGGMRVWLLEEVHQG